MTKQDIVIDISAKTGFQQIDVKRVVQQTFDLIIDALETDRRIELRGFGVLEVKRRKGRPGRNPQTGESVNIPAKTVVIFKPSQKMLNSVRTPAQEDGPQAPDRLSDPV